MKTRLVWNANWSMRKVWIPINTRSSGPSVKGFLSRMMPIWKPSWTRSVNRRRPTRYLKTEMPSPTWVTTVNESSGLPASEWILARHELQGDPLGTREFVDGPIAVEAAQAGVFLTAKGRVGLVVH